MRLLILLLVAALLGLGLGLGLNSPSAQAHANLLRAQPAENAVVAQSPAEVHLWFSEAVELRFSRVQVIDPAGKRYDNDDLHNHGDATNPGITLQPNLPPGTYTVVWSALSAVDGHRTAGTFAFSVGVAPPEGGPAATAPPIDLDTGGPPRWLSIFSRWLNFAAMAAFIGAVGFPLLILPSGLRSIPSRRSESLNSERTRHYRNPWINVCRARPVAASYAIDVMVANLGSRQLPGLLVTPPSGHDGD